MRTASVFFLATAVVCTFAVAAHAAPQADKPTAAPSGQTADEFYAAGVEAQGNGDWKAAETLFAKALTKRKHYQIQANLGASQLKLKKYRSAAANLREALSAMRKSSDADGGQVRAVNNFLKEAEQKLVTVKVTFSIMGQSPTEKVRVTADGEVVQVVGGYIYVLPGKHAFEAQIRTASERQSIAGQAGDSRNINFSLRPASSAALRPLDVEGTTSGTNKPAWPIGVGAGLVAVGAGLAVAGFVVAGSAVTDEAAATVATNSSGEEPHAACAQPTNANIDACNAWRDEFSAETNMKALGGAGVGLAASAAIATIVYLIWPSSSGDTSTAVRVVPQLKWNARDAYGAGSTRLTFAGIGVEGSF